MNYKSIAIKTLKILMMLGTFIGIVQGTVIWGEMRKSIDVPVSIGGRFVYTDGWEKGYASGQGTWVISGEKQDDPLNKVEISCFRTQTQKFCAIATASVYGLASSGHMLSSNLDVFDVETWDHQTIIYKDVKPCAETTFSISRETKTISGLRKYKTTGAGCSPDNPKEVRYELVDGTDVYLKGLQERNSVALNVFVLTVALLFLVFGIYKVVRQPSR